MTIQLSSYSSIADIFMEHGVDSKGIIKSKQVIEIYIFMYHPIEGRPYQNIIHQNISHRLVNHTT